MTTPPVVPTANVEMPLDDLMLLRMCVNVIRSTFEISKDPKVQQLFVDVSLITMERYSSPECQARLEQMSRDLDTIIGEMLHPKDGRMFVCPKTLTERCPDGPACSTCQETLPK